MRGMIWLVALAAGVGLTAAVAQESVDKAVEAEPSVAAIVKAGSEPTAPEAGEPVAPRAEAAKPKLPTPPSLVAKINLSTQRLEVLVGGVSRHSWAISSGRDEFPTPRGSFRVQWTAKIWHSRKYDNAPMPHAVFFTGGVAVHATQATGMLGRPASHGCIRLAPANAAQFYALVEKHGTAQTQIQVFGSPPATPIASRRERVPVARLARHEEPLGLGLGTQRAGVVHLPAGSRYAGSASFVHNGIRYVKVR